MKAFILDRYGSKVALRLGEMADPTVREEDVLVQIHDKVFPFQSTNEALAYVETGRAKGKVVIRVK
jgi:NADPH:quinone reductase-like Zn-dependent oxidoreductase